MSGRPGWVLTNHNNAPEGVMSNEYAYVVKDDTGNKALVDTTGTHPYIFGTYNYARTVCNKFKPTNGYGIIKWRVMSFDDWSKIALSHIDSQIILMRQCIERINNL